MKYLGTYEITNTNNKVDEINLINFLRNTENHSDDSNIYYSKVGNMYFFQGTVTFDELEIDILPEDAVVDSSFIAASTGELIEITKGQTTLTAPTSGAKLISGFYFTDNGENRNG